ncbi:hypothetical protein PVAP13_4NG139965 [Panicum virgatum]|uniref:Trimethylguanosine synthase n=1 Tax=Panicum virgatum TaxID=38727 RepID=A0A8T0T0Q7_PANVG|nr:hypothetical protein PVAP13_4NG139965 [Panicum virgatum]
MDGGRTNQPKMAKTNAAPPRPGRRARALPFLHHRTTHRFLRLLGATTTKTARRHRRTARPTHNRRVARPAEPKERAVGAAEPDGPRDPDAAADAAVVAGKYWAHRHSLFSLYDRGVRMDGEGWYSATPEAIAASQAARAAPGDLVVDAFAGCGANSIQFAARGCFVVAVEIDPRKVELAAHNARVYGVEDRIQFVVGDFFRLAPFLKADLVFLSPPWGGPSYIHAPVYTLDMLKPKDGYTTFQAAQKIAPNVIMFLPRTVDISQVEELSWLSSPALDFEV